MKITVSGENKDVKDGITVTELIAQEKVETPEYVTVSVNEEFIKRENFDTTALKEGDVVEFLYFMGGGSSAAGEGLIGRCPAGVGNTEALDAR